MFPDAETSRGKRTALIITRSNEIKFIRPRAIHQRMFWVKDMGLFQFNEDYIYQRHRSPWYIYDQSCTNPVSFQALLEINTWLESQGRPHMTIEDVKKYVYQIRYIDQYEKDLAEWVDKLLTDGVSQKDLYAMFFDGSLEAAVKKSSELKVRQEAEKAFEKGQGEFSDHTKKWLNDFMSEDVVARNYLFQRILTEQKFKLWPSLPVFAINMFQKTKMKKYLALIVRDNRVVELDLDITIRKELNTGKFIIHSKEYNDFELKSQRAVYRHGKTRVFFLLQWSPFAYEKLPAIAQSTTQAKPQQQILNAEVLV